MTTKKWIAHQQLENVQRELGGELCRALELLTGTLHYEFDLPWRRQGDSPRQYAELREARSVVNCLKYGVAEPVRTDELSWALSLVRRYYSEDAHGGMAGAPQPRGRNAGRQSHPAAFHPGGLKP